MTGAAEVIRDQWTDQWTTVWQHDDPAAFAELAMPLLHADPVRHTVAITVLTGQLRLGERHGVQQMISVHHDDGSLHGVALQTAGWPLIASALPINVIPAVAAVLADRSPDLAGVSGPLPEAEAFAAAWRRRTGRAAVPSMAKRLFELGRLVPPAGVPGAARTAGADDVALVAGWVREFEAEALPADWPRRGEEAELVAQQISTGHTWMLWECDGEPVAMAFGSMPTAGMSRIGSVWTLPERRGRRFGSAVTAAVSRWALDGGAGHVLLYTDLANPVSNTIYPRIGYRPVLDDVDLRFQ